MMNTTETKRRRWLGRHDRTGQANDRKLTSRDLGAAGVIGAVLVAVFIAQSPGLALVVTFVPGVLAAFALLAWTHQAATGLPEPDRLGELFFVAMAMQLLHFAEEYVTGFPTDFPELYGGDPIPLDRFVVFNMAMYALFTLSGLAYFAHGRRLVLMPAMFFIVYGTLGNAVAHTTWALMTGGYFPGLVTGLCYWPIGTLLIWQFVPSRRNLAGFIVGFTLLLTATITAGHAIAT